MTAQTAVDRLGLGRIRLPKSGQARAGLAILVCLWLACFVGGSLTGSSLAQDMSQILQPPSKTYLLGTDKLGRDQLARVLQGGQTSLLVALGAVFVSMLVGVGLGLFSGYFSSSFVSIVIDRIADILISLPALVLAITLSAILGPSIPNTILAIGIIYAPQFLRLTRGEALRVAGMPYIDTGRAAGAGHVRLLVKYVWPNIAPPIVAYTFLCLAAAMLAESALSFLGVGLQPPYPSWGYMIRDGASYVQVAWWLVIPPGLCLFLAALGYTLLGDGLRRGSGDDKRDDANDFKPG